MNVLRCNAVNVEGRDHPILFEAHGFAFDRDMRISSVPGFRQKHVRGLFDPAGRERSDSPAFDPEDVYGSRDGFAACEVST